MGASVGKRVVKQPEEFTCPHGAKCVHKCGQQAKAIRDLIYRQRESRNRQEAMRVTLIEIAKAFEAIGGSAVEIADAFDGARARAMGAYEAEKLRERIAQRKGK